MTATPARAWGGPAGSGRLRVQPEDFRVDEVLGFEPGGSGEHAWLYVRKRGLNSDDVAWALARCAGVARRAVGASGMKDRHAETGQWFSVHLPGREDPDWAACADTSWRVERALRNARKLRPGAHRWNRFGLRVRALDADTGLLGERLEAVRAGGFPNYFGPQRFGHGGENLRKARAALAGVQGGRRRVRGLYLSAARAWLFNQVLARRIVDGTWCRPQPGDALMLAGTRSVFECSGDERDLGERIAAFDLDVTGPLWGVGAQPVSAAVAAREAAWLADERALREGLERIGMAARRRPLRAPARGLRWSLNGDTLELEFTLPRGAYATSLVRELLDTDAAG